MNIDRDDITLGNAAGLYIKACALLGVLSAFFWCVSKVFYAVDKGGDWFCDGMRYNLVFRRRVLIGVGLWLSITLFYQCVIVPIVTYFSN